MQVRLIAGYEIPIVDKTSKVIINIAYLVIYQKNKANK